MKILDRLLALAEQHTRMVLLELKQPLLPSWVLISRDHHIDVECTPWENEHQKQIFEVRLRKLMKARNTIAYSFVTEAWMATAPKSWNPDTGPTMRASDQPDKIEVAIAFACNAKHAKWKRWAIKRDWHEQIIRLEELPQLEGNVQPEGWMTKLLK